MHDVNAIEGASPIYQWELQFQPLMGLAKHRNHFLDLKMISEWQFWSLNLPIKVFSILFWVSNRPW